MGQTVEHIEHLITFREQNQFGMSYSYVALEDNLTDRSVYR